MNVFSSGSWIIELDNNICYDMETGLKVQIKSNNEGFTAKITEMPQDFNNIRTTKEKKELVKQYKIVQALIKYVEAVFSGPRTIKCFEKQASFSSLIEVLKTKYPRGGGFPVNALKNKGQLEASLRERIRHEIKTLDSIGKEYDIQKILTQSIPNYNTIRKVELFIKENFTRKITLEEVAKIAGLSQSYFSTIFKKSLGEGFPDYINRLRVEKAKIMLLETELSLFDIFNACGFKDQSWFTKTFKAFTGSTPSNYRKNGG